MVEVKNGLGDNELKIGYKMTDGTTYAGVSSSGQHTFVELSQMFNEPAKIDQRSKSPDSDDTVCGNAPSQFSIGGMPISYFG